MLRRATFNTPPPRRRPRTARPANFPWDGLLLFATAFLLRAGYAWLAMGPRALPFSDAASYDTVAWNLARGAGFSLNGATGPYPTAFVPPVLPWLVSLVYRAFGHQFFAAIVLQCAVGALVPLLLAAFARGTFGSAVARWAGWIAALNPLLIFFCGYLLTETLFSLMLLLALHVSAEWVKTPRPGRALGAGIVWGLAALTRPTALPLPLLIGAWAWVPLGLTLAPRDRVRQLLLLLLGVGLALVPWTLRNAGALHAFVPVTTGSGRSLLDANNPLVWDDPARRGGATSVYGLEPWAARFKGLDEHEVDVLSGRLAREFMLARLPQWPVIAVAKVARFWRLTSEGGGTGSWQSGGSTLGRALAFADPLLLWSLVVLPFAIAGLAVVLRGAKRLFLSLPALVLLAFTLGAVVYWGALRMRVPVEPLIALYAAAGLDTLAQQLRVRRSGLTLVRGGR